MVEGRREAQNEGKYKLFIINNIKSKSEIKQASILEARYSFDTIAHSINRPWIWP